MAEPARPTPVALLAAATRRDPTPLRLWLCDLTHFGSGPASETIPMGVGYLAAYAEKECRLENRPRVFKYPAALAAALEVGPLPDVVGFSQYIWNSELSVAFAREVKKRSPETVVVFGGPHFPKDPQSAATFLRERPEIDLYVEGEGELALARLLECIARGSGWRSSLESDVPSLRWIDDAGKFRTTDLAARIGNLDVIPSPYLSALLDEFFDGLLVPTIQTNRGCPFTCAFCLEGNQYYSRVARFSEERVVAELEYIGQTMSDVVGRGGRDDLLITDSNFAMYGPDRTTCEQIRRCREKYGWPSRVNVTTGKNRRERVLDSISLTDGAIQLSGAVQSLDLTVLELVNRQNIDATGLIDIAQRSSARGTPTYSDVILGLPGDTRNAHVDTVCTLVDAGFSRVNTFQFAVLPGTALDTASERERHGIVTRYRVVPRALGRYALGEDAVTAVEVDEVCIATSSMSFEDYLWCRQFDLALFMLYNDGVFSATNAVARAFGLKVGDALRLACDVDWPHRLDVLRRQYVNDTEGQLFPSREECIEAATESIGDFLDGRFGVNLLYTYRALAIAETLEDLATLAHALFRQISPSSEFDEFIEDAIRFDSLSLNSVFETSGLDVLVADFNVDIPGLISDQADHSSLASYRRPTSVEFAISDGMLRTREAYARAMGDDPAGIGRMLTRVPMSDLRRVPRPLGLVRRSNRANA